MPKIKPFVDFTWWLNANTTNAVGDKDLIIAKVIPWYENYTINSLWEVTNAKFNRKLKVSIDNLWYNHVQLYKDWFPKTIKVHKLVALLFIWERTPWLQINHIDWNKQNNNVSNLEYCTASYNTSHAYKLWLCTKPVWCKWLLWDKSKRHKKVICRGRDWNIIKVYNWSLEAERETWICNTNINKCCAWKRNHAGWFIRERL